LRLSRGCVTQLVQLPVYGGVGLQQRRKLALVAGQQELELPGFGILHQRRDGCASSQNPPCLPHLGTIAIGGFPVLISERKRRQQDDQRQRKANRPGDPQRIPQVPAVPDFAGESGGEGSTRLAMVLSDCGFCKTSSIAL